ncbi:MAG: hypothetical protein ACJ79P_23225 [Myxococcales bacterium]
MRLVAGVLVCAGAASAQVIVHADQVLRPVPAQLVGANLTSYGKTGTSVADWEPCCLGPASMLPQPVALWRTPGGILGDFFHLNGLYDNTNLGAVPNGVDLIHFVNVAERLHGGLVHVLNINASDQELVNEVEYLNSQAPATPDPAWTRTSFRFDAVAPAGYFAWLRGQHGHPAPAAVKYLEIGNEVWNTFNDTDTRCNHDATCYGVQAAALSRKLKQKDPAVQVGLSILTLGQFANRAYLAPRIYAGFKSAGTSPDFVFDHGYYNCKPGPENGTEAQESVLWADGIAAVARRNRRELTAAFGADRAARIALFLDEFGPQACGNGPDAWEGFGPWQAAAAAHVYAAALHAGFTHVSYYSWNGDPQNADAAGYGLVNGTSTVDANFWGVWLASRFLAGAASEVAVTGAPDAVRAFAVRSRSELRVLLVNGRSGAPATISLAVSGASAGPAVRVRLDPSYAAIAVPARRRAVPQTTPRPAPANLSAVELPALSATLLEIPVTIASSRGRSSRTSGSRSSSRCSGRGPSCR